MTKPTKKRIEEVAKKLRKAYCLGDPYLLSIGWKGLTHDSRRTWRRVAEVALTELGDPTAYKTPPYLGGGMPRRRPAKQPKACRIDGGKRICK